MDLGGLGKARRSNRAKGNMGDQDNQKTDHGEIDIVSAPVLGLLERKHAEKRQQWPFLVTLAGHRDLICKAIRCAPTFHCDGWRDITASDDGLYLDHGTSSRPNVDRAEVPATRRLGHEVESAS